MRWERLFEDLEDQLASEWEAERAALDSEAERLRLSRLGLTDRLRGVAELRSDAVSAVELVDGTVLSARISVVGADWVGLDPPAANGASLIPVAAISAIGLPIASVLTSARPDAPSRRPRLAERMTMGFVLRDLARRRVPVTVHTLDDRARSGTIDRALLDHLDIALHDRGAPRRAAEVSGMRLIPYGAISWVRLDASTAVV